MARNPDSILQVPKLTITITDENLALVREFADAMDKDGGANSRYEEKGHGKNALYKNQVDGKLSEFAVYQLLVSKKQNPSLPDLSVWTAEERRVNGRDDPDIVTAKSDYHIKSTSEYMAKKLGDRSWSFRKEDPIIATPTARDMVVCCTVMDERNVYIDFLARASNLMPYYLPPVNPKYRDSKWCLYWKDIKNL